MHDYKVLLGAAVLPLAMAAAGQSATLLVVVTSRATKTELFVAGSRGRASRLGRFTAR